MARIGWAGCGKLGLPTAVAIATNRGDWLPQHRVMCYDADPKKMRKRQYEHKEAGYGTKSFQQLFDEANLEFAPLDKIVRECKTIFIAVQTPHEPKFDGTYLLPAKNDEPLADFDYRWLENSVRQVVAEVNKLDSDFEDCNRTLAIISTVLPGTIRRQILPLLSKRIQIVYNPFFAAMGTCIQNFLEPEFVLLGSEDPKKWNPLVEFYAKFLPNAAVKHVSIESAELTKMAYNSMISAKICLANTWGEIAHKTPGCDVDEVSDALSCATNRLWSPRYSRAGLGDGGPCHARDLVALSWLGQEKTLSFNLFAALAVCREEQTKWLADVVEEVSEHHQLPVVILGTAFKPETNLVDGSCAILLQRILKERGVEAICHDPRIDMVRFFDNPSLFFIGCKHQEFASWKFRAGDVVIDPHRFIPDQEGVKVIRLGVGI